MDALLLSLALTAQLLAVLRAVRCLLLPSLVLIVGWGLSGWIFASLQREHERLTILRFDNMIEDAESAIRDRMIAYSDALYGGASLFAASEKVTRDEWRRYVDSLDLATRYPGANGLGVIFPVKSADIPGFVRAVAEDGVPDFSIHGVPGARKPLRDPAGWDHFVIVYIEPVAVNWQALGLDLASEVNRQTAARVSRDYGEPRITGPITLVQDGKKRPGFLLYVPFYDADHPITTVHDRRMHFRGWVYAPFVTENFLIGVLGKRNQQLDLCVYNGLSTAPEDLVFNTGKSVPDSFERTTVLQLAGQEFTCGWNRGPGYPEAEGEPLLTAITLALVPTLLAGLVLSLQTTTRRASELADERTHALRRTNAEMQNQIAQREQAEAEALDAREEAEAANRAKSEFLATMSHEIRTPMNGVIGYADLLVESDLGSEQSEWAGIIQSSGRALLAIINDILDFSKIESGKLQLESIPFDPVASVREVVQLLKTQADQKGLELSICREVEIPHVLGDPTRFKQILLNLVSNAIKFTDKGSVRVRMHWSLVAGDCILRIDVTDTGMGIPEDKRKRLFQRFSQLDSSTTRRFGGTGLGLAICKHLVELMGGEIGASSATGIGTTIWFEIPMESAVKVEVNPETVATDVDALRSFGKYVLLAEDVMINQKLATIVLNQLGCTVDIASNGREAIEKALSHRYDIIYMDCQMPEVDGLEATREIRKRETHHIPIVALTASALEGDRGRCFAAGMDDYLTKPLVRADLVRTLKAL